MARVNAIDELAARTCADNPLELIAIASVAFVINAITRDGQAAWFEGLLLVAVYALLVAAFFFATPDAGVSG